MDLYSIGKFLHIAVAIAWLGGGFGMVLLGHLAVKAGDGERAPVSLHWQHEMFGEPVQHDPFTAKTLERLVPAALGGASRLKREDDGRVTYTVEIPSENFEK